jgi:small-conductance mechanosensitive channel
MSGATRWLQVLFSRIRASLTFKRLELALIRFLVNLYTAVVILLGVYVLMISYGVNASLIVGPFALEL